MNNNGTIVEFERVLEEMFGQKMEHLGRAMKFKAEEKDIFHLNEMFGKVEDHWGKSVLENQLVTLNATT